MTCGETLRSNRPNWESFLEDGDVKSVDWGQYKNKVTVLHGVPPCQPFSMAGKRKGDQDERDMWGSFVKVIRTINPDCFVAENVKGILSKKFQLYVSQNIINPLKDKYHISSFQLTASDFGVPQKRQRVFFVGFRNQDHFKNYIKPVSTHYFTKISETDDQVELFKPTYSKLKKCMGMREALGLPDIGHDDLCPTLRSGFTGPRFSTSLLNSKASEKSWANLQIWPNGVGSSREKSRLFVAKNKHFRLSVQDVALLQGFPKSWAFSGAVYQVLGQIGNSVCPPMAYQVAVSVSRALKGT